MFAAPSNGELYAVSLVEIRRLFYPKWIFYIQFLFLQDLPVYSCEEKALMAEILRDDQLNERREKARNVDMKLHEAKLRRMFLEAQAVAVRKERLVYVCLPFTKLQSATFIYCLQLELQIIQKH